MKYKRYMVFSWSTYDNVDPFGCVDGSFDDFQEAIDLAVSLSENNHSCVFDRIDGVNIASYKYEDDL